MQHDHGDVTAEYLALRSGTGFVSGHSEVLWVRGPDAVSFLDGQVSQDVAAMPVGSTARSFLLEPRGKLAALLWLLRGDDVVGIVVDLGYGADVVERLERFRFRVDASIETDPRPVFEIWGVGDVDFDAATGQSVGSGWMDAKDATYAVLSGRGLSRCCVIGGNEESLVELGLTPAGSIAADTVRVEAGEPVMGRDVDDGTIPQESGLVDASVSFTKGCYLGQELVARIDSRGRVNRRLVGIRLTSNVIPPVGSELVFDDSVIGTVSTVGESLTFGAPVGLAMARREAEAGAVVDVRWEGGEAEAIVDELPLGGPGATS